MDNGTVMLLEIATRSICLDFGGHIGAVNDLSFSPDGKLLASAGSDGTVLLWDFCLLSLAKADPPAMTEQTLAKLWSDLGAKDAKVAFRASNLFCRQPKQSSAFVEKQLQDLWKFDPKEIRRLIAQLNDKSYATREKAIAELLRWEDLAAAQIHEALNSNPTLEARKRLELLVRQLNAPTPSPKQLLLLRSLAVLECAATKGSRALLEQMAAGAPESWVGREACLTLGRMKKQGGG